MARIEEFLPILLKIEGGYVDDPIDRGGATHKGITLNTYRCYYGSNKTKEQLQRISDNEVRSIYKVGYWDKCGGDKIVNQSVANLFVDYAVNSGVYRAVREIQRLVGVADDGVVGSKTISAINSKNPKELFRSLYDRRLAYYEEICKKNPSQKKFLNGWKNRLKFYKFA